MFLKLFLVVAVFLADCEFAAGHGPQQPSCSKLLNETVWEVNSYICSLNSSFNGNLFDSVNFLTVLAQ